MKSFRLLIWSAAICGAAVFTGCVDTADTPLSPMEQEWERAIRNSYPGYRAPKTMAPAVRDNVVYYDAPKSAVKENVPAADDDPAKAIDKAADAPADAVVPVAQEQQPAAVEKKNDAPAAKAEEKADKKAEKKDAVKPAEKAAPAKEAAAPAKTDKSSAEVVVKAGDTIGGIAKEFYGNAKYADVILKANPQIKDAKRLKIGTKLVIPAL